MSEDEVPKAEMSKEEAPKREMSRDPNTIFIGKKPPMNYVLAVMTNFNTSDTNSFSISIINTWIICFNSFRQINTN